MKAARVSLRTKRGSIMDKRLLAQLNDADVLLWRETEREAMATLDEDGVSELHNRIRRARDKYTGQYRREASARVADRWARKSTACQLPQRRSGGGIRGGAQPG